MTEGVNAKGAVLQNDHAENAGNQESAQGRSPAAPGIADRGRQSERDQRANQMDVPVLPPDQWILLQVRHVVEGGRWIKFEQQPADVGVEKALGDTVRVIVVIDVFVVAPMFASPQERGVFEGAGPKNQRKQTNRPMRLECQMREKPVITDRYRESARAEHDKEKNNLEEIDPEEIQVGRYGRK